MKRILLIAGTALLAGLILAVVAAGLLLDRGVKAAVETVGPRVAQVDVQLADARLSLLSGSGAIQGLLVANPEGYDSPSAIEVGKASLAVSPRSIFADKLVVRHIRVADPVITFEGGLSRNNLKTILQNVQASASSDSKPKEDSDPDQASLRRLQIDELALTGARVNVHLEHLGGREFVLMLPDIRLENLGAGAEGITSRDLTRQILDVLLQAAIDAVLDSLQDEEGLGGIILEGLGQELDGDAGRILRGIRELLKK